jgi:carboxypeptidase D
MLETNDTTYYNFSSLMIYDPSLSYGVVQEQIPTAAFIDYWSSLFYLNSTFTESLHQMSESCGYTSFLDSALTFPPKGPLPSPPEMSTDFSSNSTCDTFDNAIAAITALNPCFDIYQVATTCPLLWDVLGFPGSIPYLPQDAFIYFNLSDVQKAINAPATNWEECASNDVFVNGTDTSSPSALSVLPNVIEKADRVIIGHGILDMVLLFNGTLVAVQNMTWNGAQGFSKAPADWDSFYVPYTTMGDTPYELATLAGAGNVGIWHEERGLTVATVQLSGHMIPQYAPSAAYRLLEVLLGRVGGLNSTENFSTAPSNGSVIDR